MKKRAIHKLSNGALSPFLEEEWLDIYDALMGAAEAHHSGPKADRILALARRIREEIT
jgi:hypothetical protein